MICYASFHFYLAYPSHLYQYVLAHLDTSLSHARSRRLLTITITTCIGYFSAAMVYFGLFLAATAYNVNPFMYVVISGLVELPSNLNIFLVEKIGRKKSGMICFGVCAVPLLIQPLIPDSECFAFITL